MDGDLQNDPRDIPLLLAKIDEGYDVVSGWRKDRKDAWLTRRVPSWAANRLISKITNVRLHDYGCALKAYRREVLRGIRLYGEMHRFIPALSAWMGIRVAEVPVRHRARVAGKSKYGLERAIPVILDLINVKFLVSYSTRPIQVFGKVGIASFFAGFLFLALTVLMKYLQRLQHHRRPVLHPLRRCACWSDSSSSASGCSARSRSGRTTSCTRSRRTSCASGSTAARRRESNRPFPSLHHNRNPNRNR